MNVKDAAAFLSARGFMCKAGTVRALWRTGKLGCHRGPSNRGPMQFFESELERFLREEMIRGPKVEKKKAVSVRLSAAETNVTPQIRQDWAKLMREEKGT